MSNRRDFVKQAVLAGTLPIVPVGILASPLTEALTPAGAPGVRPARGPVVSFFWDQPYVDYTGLAQPYYPPRGARSGQPVAHLSEEALRRAFCWI
jgi:hypothetical protein